VRNISDQSNCWRGSAQDKLEHHQSLSLRRIRPALAVLRLGSLSRICNDPDQMNAATERKILRWLHVIFSIPIVGYIYGPVADIPPAAAAVRFVFLPVIVLTGIWMWKGPSIRRLLRRPESLTFAIFGSHPAPE
jgi:hypothetical protein